MHNSTWKKERDLLSEAYDSIAETTHSVENSLNDDEDSDHYKKTGEIKKKEDKDSTVDEDAITDTVEDLPEPSISDMPSDVDHETQELDKDVQDLISLIANPPPEEELMRLGYEGRLSEYVSMLQKKVDAAQAQLDLRKPAEESGA